MTKDEQIQKAYEMLDFFHKNPPGSLPSDIFKLTQKLGAELHKIYLLGYEDGLNNTLDNVEKILKDDSENETKANPDL